MFPVRGPSTTVLGKDLNVKDFCLLVAVSVASNFDDEERDLETDSVGGIVVCCVLVACGS